MTITTEVAVWIGFFSYQYSSLNNVSKSKTRWAGNVEPHVEREPEMPTNIGGGKKIPLGAGELGIAEGIILNYKRNRF
jgi:hypothetical protein